MLVHVERQRFLSSVDLFLTSSAGADGISIFSSSNREILVVTTSSPRNIGIDMPILRGRQLLLDIALVGKHALGPRDYSDVKCLNFRRHREVRLLFT